MWKGLTAGLGAGALWGFTFLVPKVLGDHSPAEVALGRYFFFAIASVVVLIPKWRSISKWISRETISKAIVLSLAGYSLYYYLMALAVRNVGPTFVSLIIGLLPLTVPLLSRSRGANAKLFRVSMLLVALGIAFVNIPSLPLLLKLKDLRHWQGLALSFAALFIWTWFAVANAKFLKERTEIDNISWTCLLGIFSFLSMAILFMMDLSIKGIPFQSLRITPAFLFWTAIIGIGSSWLATWLWNIASATLPVSLTGQLIVSETIFAILYATIHEGTLPSVWDLAGIMTLIAGVLIGVRSFQSQ